jgi:hypothetical protein
LLSGAVKGAGVQRYWRLLPAGLAVASFATLALVDPMRWSLPTRYLVQPFDIYREGFFDDLMCMRVELTPEEARDFVAKRFAPEQTAPVAVPGDAKLCPAPFWPERFVEKTLGFDGRVRKGEMRDGGLGSSGAVYQDGNLYFWSNNYSAP